MSYTVQVQHSSDYNLDGKWYDLETVETEEQAQKLVKYFGEKKRKPKGIRPEKVLITGSYAGRPLRYIQNGA